MSFSDVKGRTSAAVGSEDEGALFDETVHALKRLAGRAENLMIEAISYSFPASLKAYRDKPQWTTVDDVDGDGSLNQALLTTTAELDGLLQSLKTNMDFLERALGAAPFRRIYSHAFGTLQDCLWNDILMRERFTTLGAAQFYRDVAAIWFIVDRYFVGGSSSALGMPKLREGVQLLNLPLKAGENEMCLEDVNRRLFTSNDEAKKVLEELKYETITPNEARQVLQRRVECDE
jgi:hypothetical protein